MDDRAVVERQLGRRAARVPSRSRPLSVRAAGGDRAVAVRRERRSFPDDVLADLPASRRGRLAPRGGRRRRAWSERARSDARARREPRRQATAEQRRLRPELPLGIGGASRDGQPQVPARPRRVRTRAPGYELGDRILAELPSLWPRAPLLQRLASSRCHSRSHASTGSAAFAELEAQKRDRAVTRACSTASTP